MAMQRYSDLITGTFGKAHIDMSDSALTYALHKRPTNSRIPLNITFRFSERLLSASGFKLKDRIDLLFDMSTKQGKIVRAPGGGYALTNSGGSGAIVRIPYIPASGLPSVDHPIALEGVKPTAEGIDFRFPALIGGNGAEASK